MNVPEDKILPYPCSKYVYEYTTPWEQGAYFWRANREHQGYHPKNIATPLQCRDSSKLFDTHGCIEIY